MILADTNVISEFMRAQVDPAVLRWATSIGPADLAISAITVQEIELGILRLPPGRRRDARSNTWAGLMDRFDAVVVPYDRRAASAGASVLAEAAARGHAMSLADAQIAGACLAHDAVLATRNVKDFDHEPRLTVINPFERGAE